MTISDRGDATERIRCHRGPVAVDVDGVLVPGRLTASYLESLRPRLLALGVVAIMAILHRDESGPKHERRAARLFARFLPRSVKRWERSLRHEVGAGSTVEAVRSHGDRLALRSDAPAPLLAALERVLDLNPGSSGALAAARSNDQMIVTSETYADDGGAIRAVVPDRPRTSAFRNTYFPFRYLSVVKRPGARYVWKVAKEDLALWILGSVWLATNPIPHAFGLVFLAIAFWAIYEYGYVDNDRAADRFERTPQLTEAYHEQAMTVHWAKPVAVAAVSSTIGLVLLRWPDQPTLGDAAAWGAVLAVTASVFFVYNRIDKTTRVLVFPVLQLLRTGSFAVLVPTTAVADLAIATIVMVRSFHYHAYRSRREGWPDDDLTAVRLIVFASATALLASQDGWGTLVSATTVSLLLWQAFLANRTIRTALRRARWIASGE